MRQFDRICEVQSDKVCHLFCLGKYTLICAELLFVVLNRFLYRVFVYHTSNLFFFKFFFVFRRFCLCQVFSGECCVSFPAFDFFFFAGISFSERGISVAH